MPKRKPMTETIVGVFVIGSLALLLLIVVLIGRNQNIFEQRVQITGVFNSVAGLQTGAEVHLAGINIGHVKDIEFGATNKVNVVMSLSAAQMKRIRADSVASIRTMGLMGDRYVEITVGSQDQPEIPNGGTIRTMELFELTELLEAARPVIKNVENAVENISLITDELADPNSGVRTVINNVKDLTQGLEEGQGTIGALLKKDDVYLKVSSVLDTTQETMSNFQKVSKNAVDASAEFPGAMEEVKSSLEKFAEFSDTAANAATDIAEIVDSGKDVMGDVKVVASNLKSASEDIREATPRIGPLISSADEGVNEAKQVVEAAKHSWLLRGYFQPGVPGEPLAVTGRDIATLEVAQ